MELLRTRDNPQYKVTYCIYVINSSQKLNLNNSGQLARCVQLHILLLGLKVEVDMISVFSVNYWPNRFVQVSPIFFVLMENISFLYGTSISDCFC